jgi:hypothetical protein
MKKTPVLLGELYFKITNFTHKRPVISPTASTGYFLEAYKI